LFTADPKKDGSARLITNCSLDELEKMRARMKKIRVDDVTGGMLGKIIELSPAIEKGISALIVNASKPKTIYKALAGEKVTGTLIQKT
jgi:isopentenyl phosphate kinase